MFHSFFSGHGNIVVISWWYPSEIKCQVPGLWQLQYLVVLFYLLPSDYQLYLMLPTEKICALKWLQFTAPFHLFGGTELWDDGSYWVVADFSLLPTDFHKLIWLLTHSQMNGDGWTIKINRSLRRCDKQCTRIRAYNVEPVSLSNLHAENLWSESKKVSSLFSTRAWCNIQHRQLCMAQSTAKRTTEKSLR